MSTAKRGLELVFTDPLTKPKPKRQQVSKACEWCRTLRIKCDSRFPCSNCQTRGRTCNVRNTSSTQTFSDALKRIETLQDRIKDLEKQLETARAQAHGVVSDRRSEHPIPQVDGSQERDRRGSESRSRSRRRNVKRLESIHIQTVGQSHCYGQSSSFYFIGRLSSHLGIAPHQLTPDGLMQLDSETRATSKGQQTDTNLFSAQYDVLITEQYLSRSQEEYFLSLFWPSYNVYYPIVDQEHFKNHYQSLWTSQLIRKPSALVDILLAICMQYADALMPRDYPAFRANVEGVVNVNIDAIGIGRKFYRRCQLLLTDELNGPSTTTLQCHFFSVIYLSNASYHNVAHNHLASAVRTGVTLGLHWQQQTSESLPRDQADFNCRLWWTVFALEMKVAMDLGRPLAVDLSEVTCHVPECHGDDARMHEGTKGFMANKHYVRLMLASRSVYAAFQKKYSEVLQECNRNNNDNQNNHDNIKDLYSNPEALEKVAAAFAPTVQSLHDWRQEVPELLKTTRMNGGEPLSTDRTPLNLKQHVPLGLSRSRLFLELLYHNVCMNLYRPFICFFHPPAPDSNGKTNAIFSLSHAASNHAIAITSIIHQALKQSNFLAGFHETFQWQWNATITLIGFLASAAPNPTANGNLVAPARKALKMAIQVFDIIGKYLGIACSAGKVTRELLGRVDRLTSSSSSSSLRSKNVAIAMSELGPTANSFASAHGNAGASTSTADRSELTLRTWDMGEKAEFASSWATYPGGDLE